MNQQESGSADLKTARSLIRQRNYSGAIKMLQDLQEADPDEETLELLGMAQFFDGQLDEALETFEELTRVNSGHTKAWVNMGAILNRQGEHKRAVEVLRRAIQKDRKCAEAYYNMGIGQRGLSLNTMAISAYKEAIRLKPDMVEAHLNLGNIYLDMKNTALAVQCFQAALKQNPESKKAKASLEKAMHNQKAAKKEASPFGRLVDIDRLSQQEDQAAAPRVLSIAQRTDERDLVQKVTKSVRATVRELVPLLEEPLRDQLLRLQRFILQSEMRLSTAEHVEVFSRTLNEIQRFRKGMTDDLGELRQQIAEQGKS